MKTKYSIYEAKTHLSAILRRVRENRIITITDRGREVAQVCPIPEATGLEKRIEGMMRSGTVIPSIRKGFMEIPVGAPRPGSLKRFLEERHRF
jgi:prevent-host-death family protein